MDYDYIRECREAIEAGEHALSTLRDAKECLDSARNWGIFDMFGGGFFSSLIKRSEIEDAQEMMDRARKDLQRFSNELDDIHMSEQLNVEINDFLGFADLFWDSFFVDLMMQDRINDARDKLDEVIARVEQIVRRLKCESI